MCGGRGCTVKAQVLAWCVCVQVSVCVHRSCTKLLLTLHPPPPPPSPLSSGGAGPSRVSTTTADPHVCLHGCVGLHGRVWPPMRTCVYLHACLCMHACACMRARTCVCLYMHACLFACVCLCACAFLRVHAPVLRLHACLCCACTHECDYGNFSKLHSFLKCVGADVYGGGLVPANGEKGQQPPAVHCLTLTYLLWLHHPGCLSGSA